MALDLSRWRFTGKPCKRGHLTLSQRNNRTCGACCKGRDDRPKLPAIWWPVVSTWIDPADTDPRRVEKATKAIDKRAALWQTWARGATNAYTFQARRGEWIGDAFMIELPADFYRADGLPMSRDEFMLGPFRTP